MGKVTLAAPSCEGRHDEQSTFIGSTSQGCIHRLGKKGDEDLLVLRRAQTLCEHISKLGGSVDKSRHKNIASDAIT